MPSDGLRSAESRRRALEGLSKLPGLSASATRLLGRLSGRNCDLTEVTSLIEKDPLLSGQVVRSANSAAFLRLREIESVRHAIVMLGLGTIRKFVLARTVTNLFRHRVASPEFSMTRFCLHSVAVGTLVELLSDQVPLEYVEGAFLAGLFHDIGSLLLACEFPQEYQTSLEIRALTDQPLVECEHSVLGLDHAELSALVVESWGMPDPVRLCAASHHQPEPAVSQPADPPRVSLGLAVNKADEIADALGMSIENARPVPAALPAVEFPGFGFDQERWLSRFAEEWTLVDAMLR